MNAGKNNINTQTLKKEIIEKLKNKIDSKRVEWAKNYYPTKMKVLGVKAPDLKQVLSGFKPRIKRFSETEKINLIKELINTDIFEYQQFGFEIINYDKKLLSHLTEKDAFEMKKILITGFQLIISQVFCLVLCGGKAKSLTGKLKV